MFDIPVVKSVGYFPTVSKQFIQDSGTRKNVHVNLSIPEYEIWMIYKNLNPNKNFPLGKKQAPLFNFYSTLQTIEAETKLFQP